jgi:FkbM family methyltransferase
MNFAQQLKSLVRATFHKFGYSLRRLDAANDNVAVQPYIRECRVGEHSFSFWISNNRAERTYSDSAVWNEFAEPAALLEWVRPADRILEVGCNLGFFTVLLGKMLAGSGRVLAVDANSYNIMVCQAQIELNRLGGVCTARHMALSDRPGTLTIETTSNSQVIAADAPGGTRVPASTVDELDRELGPFDLLKVDVEGFEAKVLTGAEEMLKRRPRLALEIHDDQLGRYGSSVEEIFDHIGIADYQGHMITRADLCRLRPFDPASMPRNQIVNLLLRPRI